MLVVLEAMLRVALARFGGRGFFVAGIGSPRDEPPRESRDEPPRESRGGSSQSIDPIPINTYYMGPRPQ